jgi:hypothetical protein
VLLYPGLLVAVVGAVPTYMEAIKSHRLDVPFGQSFDAKTQDRLWQENFECMQNATFSNITNKQNVQIGTKVCDSGDVLLIGRRPEWTRAQYRWVSWNDVAPGASAGTHRASLDIIARAQAAEAPRMMLAQASTRVVCQKWIGNGQLMQRIETQNGCVDQVVNTFNGWVVSSKPAACTPNC